jgi:putative membrane protein insertion efficiency factor
MAIGRGLSYLVKGYQFSLGLVLGGRCRFYPSCSEYAHQSLHKHGAVKGMGKTIWRVLRCNPWNKGGYDPS